jgi:hypothetical protein
MAAVALGLVLLVGWLLIGKDKVRREHGPGLVQSARRASFPPGRVGVDRPTLNAAGPSDAEVPRVSGVVEEA